MEKLFKIYYLDKYNETIYREVKAFNSHLEADDHAKLEVSKKRINF